MSLSFAIAALALGVERLVGYPDAVFRAIGHPVTWVGAALNKLDRALNVPGVTRLNGRLRGAATLALVCLCTLAITGWLSAHLRHMSLGWIVEALLAVPLLAQKSMGDHVIAVRRALDVSLAEARNAVGMIVGRDPAQLDESGVSKAALESLAENTSDGIVAPALWLAVFGLPGIALYKVVNTADSMIGHKSERYLHFGWAAARLDDVMNFIPARLCGLLFALASGAFSRCLAAMRRDAGKHQSPNAGWPEAAFAEALDLKFGGPRAYDGQVIDLATMGSGRSTMTRADIDRGLKLYDRAMTWLFGVMVLAALVL